MKKLLKEHGSGPISSHLSKYLEIEQEIQEYNKIESKSYDLPMQKENNNDDYQSKMENIKQVNKLIKEMPITHNQSKVAILS